MQDVQVVQIMHLSTESDLATGMHNTEEDQGQDGL